MNRTGLFRLLTKAAYVASMAATLSFVSGALAVTDLQLSYGVGPKPNKAEVEPVARASADVDMPLQLEHELTVRVERMTKTTEELRAIVEAMPGPGLGPDESTSLPSQVFSDPLDETLKRLNHVEQLINDISRIIADMPAVAANTTTATAPTTPVVEPAKPVLRPAPPPAPVPAHAPPLAATTKRTILLIVGGLIAAILAKYLRHMYLRKRPSAKELAATIEPLLPKDEAIELADVMTSMGFADGAAQALVERIQSNPRQSLSHWLKLLDVYRQTGQKTQFEQATEEMHKTFNVKPTNWNEKNGDSNVSLESYPHIATQLKKLWPRPECSEYLLSLLADTRDGKRTGFPLSVVEEIVLLLAVLQSQE